MISYIFHPLFIPVYTAVFLMYWHPVAFAGVKDATKLKDLFIILFNLVLLPGFTVFLLWRLRFIDNMYLRTQKERLIPYAATMIFYFWGWYIFRNFSDVPPLLNQFLLGTFITIIAAWLMNIYFKVSMHGLAMGGLFFFILLVSVDHEGASGVYLVIATLLTGLVATSRLIVSDHLPGDVYVGLFAGAFCQLLAVWFS